MFYVFVIEATCVVSLVVKRGCVNVGSCNPNVLDEDYIRTHGIKLDVMAPANCNCVVPPPWIVCVWTEEGASVSKRPKGVADVQREALNAFCTPASGSLKLLKNLYSTIRGLRVVFCRHFCCFLAPLIVRRLQGRPCTLLAAFGLTSMKTTSSCVVVDLSLGPATDSKRELGSFYYLSLTFAFNPFTIVHLLDLHITLCFGLVCALFLAVCKYLRTLPDKFLLSGR